MLSRGPSVRLGERWVNLPHGYYLPELADRLQLLVSLPFGKLPHLDVMVVDRWTASPYRCELKFEVLSGGCVVARDVVPVGRYPNVWRSYRVESGYGLAVDLTFDGRQRLRLRFEVSQGQEGPATLTLLEALVSRPPSVEPGTA